MTTDKPRGGLVALQIAVAIATFTLFAVTINIIPVLFERGAGYSLAADTGDSALGSDVRGAFAAGLIRSVDAGRWA